jgi:sterol desaturase/sphingolipid hydroxylase (fatty acid hydroxylase superfamily)
VEWSPGVAYFVDRLSNTFLPVGASVSLTSLACALLIAATFIVWRRRCEGKRTRPFALLRALFPKRIFTSTSHFADLGFMFFNTFVYGIAFGWAFVSYKFLSIGIVAGLTALFGTTAPVAPAWLASGAITLMLFAAYELGYWIDHYLCHRIQFLWEFHKVHHTATVLTPVTNFRVHPVDTWVFANILAIASAVANGFGHYLFGETVKPVTVSDTNIILVAFVHLYIHLQHTELWISFRGLLGHLFISPAHHQIHHSMNPAHFNRNFGSCLAIWDWMFGTLHVPSREPEKMVFGVEHGNARVHTIAGALADPVIEAAGHLGVKFGRRGSAMPAAGATLPQ